MSIENDEQLEITRAKLHEFQEMVAAMKDRDDLHPVQRQVYFDSVLSMINELQDQVIEYIALEDDESEGA